MPTCTCIGSTIFLAHANDVWCLPATAVVASVQSPNIPVWVHNIPRHAYEIFSWILTTDSVRLVAFIGGYLLLLRPQLFRLFSTHQASQLAQHSQGVHMPNTSLDVGRQKSKDEGEGGEGIWGSGGRGRQDMRSRKAWQPKSGRKVMRMNAGRGYQELGETRIPGDRWRLVGSWLEKLSPRQPDLFGEGWRKGL